MRLLHFQIYLSANIFLDHVPSNNKTLNGNNGHPTSVRLPYSLVPGIDFSSVAYQRVLSTLAKQVNNDAKQIFPKSSNAIDVVSMDLGASSYILSF